MKHLNQKSVSVQAVANTPPKNVQKIPYTQIRLVTQVLELGAGA